jgi:mono/diheme cytochrome c family protein
MWLRISISLLMATSVVGTCSAQISSAEIGKRDYLNFCASCHGAEGKGDGPVAKSLRNTPADLSKLSETNMGVFPFSRVYEAIDGRFDAAVHGSREMPVWGDLFTPAYGWYGGVPYSNEMAQAVVHGRILALIEYVFRLQIK